MSLNTIKLSSYEGDKYISPHQTLVYKGVTLFGYGYLDWGTIVNQSIINLMDKIDALQDSGLSELEFDLTEYEEEQKRLRAEEFNIWKTGFTNQVRELTNLFNKEIQIQVDNLIISQNEINSETKKLIDDNYEELKIDITDLTTGLDQRILDLVNDQLLSVTQQIVSLENLVESTKASLESATQSLNTTKLKTEQALEAFKTEFLEIFEKFKDDTVKALSDNKDYLVSYIDEALAGIGNINNSLEKRIIAIETLSGTLNSTNIIDMVTSKVNEISSGIILANLNSFIDRMNNMEDILIDMDSAIDTKIAAEILEITENYDGQLQTLNSKMGILEPIVTKNKSDLIPLNEMMIEASKHFDRPEEIILNILQNFDKILFANGIMNGVVQNYKDLNINILNDMLSQLKRNTENITLINNDTLLNLIDGLKYTAFDELSLIKRQASKTKLINEHYQILKNHLDDYKSNNFKFTLILKEDLTNSVYFGFKLPKTHGSTLWKPMGIKVNNKTTGEKIDIIYEISDSYLAGREINFYGNVAVTSLGLGTNLEKFNTFIYYHNINCSQIVKLKWANLGPNDELEFIFYSDKNFTTPIHTQLINTNVIREDNVVTEEFKANYYDLLFNDLETLNKPTVSLPTLNHSSSIAGIHIGPNLILTLPDGSKEWLLRICLPGTNSEITKIEFNDGTTDHTKTFTNHSKFPLTEAEYTSRNLSATNNYYKDINSTGHIKFPINSSATTITGKLYYTINGTVYTRDINIGAAGGSTGGSTLNLGPYNISYNSTKDDLDITYDGSVKYTYTKTGEFTAAGNIFAYSDVSLKEELRNFDRSIDLDKINSYIFKYIGDDKDTIGFIAQEIQKQLPELVQEDENGKLKLNYNGMVGVLFKLLKDSKQKEMELEERLKNIEEILGIR